MRSLLPVDTQRKVGKRGEKEEREMCCAERNAPVRTLSHCIFTYTVS